MTRPTPVPGAVGAWWRRAPSGFTLLEMMLVVIIIALIAGTLIPVITAPYTADQKWTNERTMYAIVDAIMGRPDLGQPGFVGAMGRVPHQLSTGTMGIQELITEPVQDPINPPAAGGLASGWVGPFLLSYAQNPLADAWGTPFVFNTAGTANSQWNIFSAGPDRTMGTPDDIGLPDNSVSPNSSYFTIMGAVEIDLFLSRQTIIQPMPNKWLGGNPVGSVLEWPTIYMPSNTSPSVRQACQGPGMPGTCPGSGYSCAVLNSSASPSPFTPPGSGTNVPGGASVTATTTANEPLHVTCVNVPFGEQHISIPLQDSTPFAQVTPPLEMNVLVSQPVTTARVVYPYQTLAQTCPPNSTNGCLGIGWNFPPATTTISASSGSSVLVLTGKAQTIPAYPTLSALVVRVEGAVRVTAAGVTCNLQLLVPGYTPPSPYTLPPQVGVQSTNTSPTGSNQPFEVDAVLPIPANTSFAVNSIELQLSAIGGACSIPAPPAGGATQNASMFTGTITRVFLPEFSP